MLNTNDIFSDERVCRQILEVSPVGTVITDSGGTIRRINRSAQQMFGYANDDLVGRSIEVLAPVLSRYQEAIRDPNCVGNERSIASKSEDELFANRKDGSKIPIDIDLILLDSRQHGQLILANIVDATPRRQLEADRANHVTLDRLALIGQLSGGIAHEIRTPLGVIRNDIYFLQSQADRLGPEANEAIQEINTSLGKAIRIVTELLDFAREPVSRPSSTKMSKILSTALKSYPLPPGVVLSLDNSLEQLTVRVDAEQIERILINLLRNAVQAMNEQGEIEIKGWVEGERVSIEVIDSGPGISESNLQRVFDPLFTTKSTGIGLGLAISQRYALWNHGDLAIAAVPHGGACFRLTLPRASLSKERDHE